MPDVTVFRTDNADVGQLILNRPGAGNALSPSVVDELSDGFDQLTHGGARLIVFKGEGRNFCTGFDLSDLAAQSDGDLLLRFVRIEALLQKVYSAPVVTAAVGQGRVVGAGADLFAACDHRIALPGSSYAFPGAAFGLVLGTGRLAARIGRDAARAVLVSGRVLSAEDARQIGLAAHLVDEGGLDALVAGLARDAARLDPATVAAIHRVTMGERSDADLARLVRSASAPGLRERIAQYRQSMKPASARRADAQA